ncbi:ATP-dependent DNA helicase RecQ [Filibacter tadaridae]|uniref:ATP-dependent DNA helicase RecQ n=1 Tax=Filibacter tadaridae TaxID=2483811 RepID=A0A3P5XNB5_9BACL|nr:ATP-dependent DNA helicase RecQ [Filibacter tadaridae]VDC29299.1 ATP-dependent DNA helicase RecQ [Filibacter tadaridae]
MDIHTVLKNKFGFDQFRPGQEQVIQDVLEGKDTIAILPTGTGKSLCYQLPGYVLNGSVLVISPLVALMEDQVANMKRYGEKRVIALNSFLNYTEKKQITANLERYKFIFISPEMLLRKSVKNSIERLNLSLIVVDEAHCISQWGFDFRPDYLHIGEFFAYEGRPPVLALTATADKKVIRDIGHYLNLEEPTLHQYPLDRPNISYTIMDLDSETTKTRWIQQRLLETKGPGIIYVASRRRADDLSSLLQEKGLSIAAYHAGKEQEDRAFIQEQFISGEINWICATNAFGMGIHKIDIRQIIHEHIPQSIAGYIQEVGRAGRDGLQSAATLLYSHEDEGRTRFIIQGDIPTEKEIRHYTSLLQKNIPSDEAAEMAKITATGKRIIDYYLERMYLEEVVRRMEKLVQDKEFQLQTILRLIYSTTCIREMILTFFGESSIIKPESCCSVCGTVDDRWLQGPQVTNLAKRPLNWTERLIELLG